MAYKPNNMKIANAFMAKGTGNNSGFKQPNDRLLTVISYDLNKSVMHAKDEGGRKVHVLINPKVVTDYREKEKIRVAQGPVGDWAGWAIDTRMEKKIPVGSKVVAERCLPQKSYKEGNEVIYPVEAQWIGHITDPSPSKTFEGLFSIAGYNKRVITVQHWNETAVSIDNAEALEKICEELDEAASAREKGERRPGLGFQLRAIVPGEGENWTVIDTSPVIDWISKTEGDDTSTGKPVDGKEFENILNGYVGEYIDQQFPASEYPNLKVEVLTYTNYLVGSKSNNMEISEDKAWHPFYKLSHAKTKLALNDDTIVMGKNVAVKGILELTTDQADMTTRTFKSRNLVKALHAFGATGNVQSWVRTSDGKIARPHEGLKVAEPKQERKASANASAAPAAAADAPVEHMSSAPVADPFNTAAADPFGQSADNPFADTPTEAAAAPVASAPAAEAPAAAAAPAASAEPKKERFARRGTGNY